MREDEEEQQQQQISHLQSSALSGPAARSHQVRTGTGDHHKLTRRYFIELLFHLQDFCRIFPPGFPMLQLS